LRELGTVNASKRLFPLVLPLTIFLVAQFAVAAHPQSASTSSSSLNVTYNVQSFVVEQQRLAVLLGKKISAQELGELRDSLPPVWNVQTSQDSYTISSEFLKTQLASGNVESAKTWVDHVIQHAQAYAGEVSGTSEGSRAELNRILAGAEFAAVHQPSAWDIFRQRLAAWVTRQLLRIFSGLARYPIGGQILFWVVMLAGVGFLALWLFRFVAGRDRMNSMPLEIVSASRTWQEWVRMAREAAKRNDFRAAIHAAYWAGISHLEDAGAVPRDRTKTPREYLRLIAQPAEGESMLTSVHVYRQPLTELTQRLERIWYANRGAGPEDFQQSLEQLEAMGCQLG
jgi:hypothetical protein